MRNLLLPAGLCLALALPGAAQAGASQQTTIRVLAAPGSLENGHFFNRTLGVEFTPPAGWVATVPPFPAEPGKGMPLLHAVSPDAQQHLALYAVPLAGLPDQLRDPHSFLLKHSLATRGPANAPRARKQLGEPAPLELHSWRFERLDWQVTQEGAAAPPDAFETQVAGAVNGQMLLLILRGATFDAVDRLADTVDSFRFLPPESAQEDEEPVIITQPRPGAVQRVTQTETALRARLRHKVEPVYPAEALSQNVQGDVLVRVVVGVDGHVLEATVISGHPLLNDAALAAVQQWTFDPQVTDGAAVEVEARIRVSFRLKSARQAS